jgi:hypothetical protein
MLGIGIIYHRVSDASIKVKLVSCFGHLGVHFNGFSLVPVFLRLSFGLLFDKASLSDFVLLVLEPFYRVEGLISGDFSFFCFTCSF